MFVLLMLMPAMASPASSNTISPSTIPAVQQYSILDPEQPLRFNHLTSEDGLSNNRVLSVIRDSKGFMWFGTLDGLNRYDGYEFRV